MKIRSLKYKALKLVNMTLAVVMLALLPYGVYLHSYLIVFNALATTVAAVCVAAYMANEFDEINRSRGD